MAKKNETTIGRHFLIRRFLAVTYVFLFVDDWVPITYFTIFISAQYYVVLLNVVIDLKAPHLIVIIIIIIMVRDQH